MPRFTDEDELDFDVRPSAEIIPLPGSNKLVFSVKPEDERPSWTFDLRAFAVGGPGPGISPRPQLVDQLASAARAVLHGKQKHKGASLKYSLKIYFQFLDRIEERGLGSVNTIEDVTHHHGAFLKTFVLQERGLNPNTAKNCLARIKTLIETARQISGGKDFELIWPTISPTRGTKHKDVDPRVLRVLYHEVKRLHLGFLRAQADGQRLLAIGIDPRSGRNKKALWEKEENWAVFANAYIDASLEVGSLGMMKFAGRDLPRRDNSLPVQPGPAFLSPATRESYDTTRWFVPAFDDAVAAFTLFLLHTGWNPETARAIDVTEFSNWADERLDDSDEVNSKTATVAIYANKGRTGREQIAFSLKYPKCHPFQVILSMIDRSKPLRDHLVARIAEMEAREVLGEEDERVLSHMRVLRRSPWLYFTERASEFGLRVAAVGASGGNEILRQFLGDAFKNATAKSLEGVDPNGLDEYRRKFTFSDIRDGFASFIYDNSLYNVILLRAALGHGSVNATRAYIRQRRQIAERFSRFTSFQEAVFDQLRSREGIDATVLYLRVNGVAITPELLRRLRDHRYRTRMGMGCLEPTNPPSEIAPHHLGGLCAIQRCTLCIHGVVFEETLPDLAVRMAELRYIRRQTAAERFEGSTFQEEWLAIRIIIDSVYANRADEFEQLADAHSRKLDDGTVYLFDQIPPSFLLETF